ncbi:hypothetical protein ACKS0A_04834 [Histoplasma ohiense]
MLRFEPTRVDGICGSVSDWTPSWLCCDVGSSEVALVDSADIVSPAAVGAEWFSLLFAGVAGREYWVPASTVCLRKADCISSTPELPWESDERRRGREGLGE